MTATGRTLHVTLDLLDRQLRDRDRRLCGNVDDLELSRSEDTGEVFLTHILSGPGVLAYRLGRRRFGAWLTRAHARLDEPEVDRARIPIELATSIGPSIDLAVDAADLASHATERWTLDHIISHIPGNNSRARQ